MPTLPFRRRSGFLHVQAALAALALSVPTMAGAQSITITTIDGTTQSDNDLATYISSNRIQGSGNVDPLTGTSGGYTFVSGGSSPGTSGVSVVIKDVGLTDWDSGSALYSVAGGGLMTGTGDVFGNTVTLGGSTVIAGKVVGGINAAAGTVGGLNQGNKVFMNGGTVGTGVFGGVGAGENITDISHNIVEIRNGVVNGSVGGGWSTEDSANKFNSAHVHDNKVTVIDSEVNDSIHGGVSQLTGNASNNEVNVQGTATITGGDITGGFVQYDTSTGSATGNTVNITASGTIGNRIFGGYAQGSGTAGGVTADAGNKVFISNSGGSPLLLNERVYGGAAGTTGNALYNQVEIFGDVSTRYSVLGGYTDTGNASHNTVTLGGNFSGINVYGGYIENVGGSSNANDNTINIGGAAQITNAYGGRKNSGSSSGDIFTGNTLTKLSEASSLVTAQNFENVNFGYSGEAKIGTLYAETGQTVNLNTHAYDVIFDGALSGAGGINKIGAGTLTLRGVMSGLSGDFSVGKGRAVLEGENVSGVSGGGVLGSTVNVASGATFELFGNANVSGALTVNSGGTLIISTAGNGSANASISNGLTAPSGSTLLFNIHDAALYTADTNVAALTVTGGTTSFAADSVGVLSTTPLGSTLYLIDVDGVTGELENVPLSSFDVRSGFGLKYRVTDVTDGMATLGAGTVDEQIKAVSEGFLGGIGLVTQGSDAVEKGFSSAVQSVARSGGAGQSFGALGGGKVKYKTGSHVDVSGVSLVAGLAAGVGAATVGAFIEYGDGGYDSYNSFSTGKVHGSGDTDYFGGGFLGRYDLAGTPNGNAYLETTARFGRVKSDFKTGDFNLGILGQGVTARYDTRSNYYGLSLGGGYLLKLGENRDLDLYGRYTWTHQAGDTVSIAPFNERVKFSAVDSHRVRAGARYSVAWSGRSRLYAGTAWEHEFDGKAHAKIYGTKIDAPEMKGSSGLVEFGVVVIPTGNKNLSIDLGLQGYVGKREGVTGSAQLRYAF